MADIKLPSMPEPFAWVNPHEAEDYIDGVDHHFTALRRGVPGDDFPIYSAAQVRACIEANTEALRAKVDRLTQEMYCLQQQYDEKTACTIEHRGSTISCSDAMRTAYLDERRHANDLADALRTATAMLLADYPETAKRLRSLLHE